jgi:hypothetical protein
MPARPDDLLYGCANAGAPSLPIILVLAVIGALRNLPHTRSCAWRQAA